MENKNEGKEKSEDFSVDSRKVKLYNEKQIIHQDNQPNSYDKLKNDLKSLFKEFGNEEEQKLNMPPVPAINFSEKKIELQTGCCALTSLLIVMILCLILIIIFALVGKTCYYLIPIPVLGVIVCLILLCNFRVISPGEALVLTYYGQYIGTCKTAGYYWIRPCTDKHLISLKSNHYNGNMIKVNDRDGTPILMGLVCIWRINDTVKATYCVRNSDHFMAGQTESALRFVANKFPYDSVEENELTLKSGNEDINKLLKLELQRRTKMAGIEIEDARITEIAYGQEIASAMLQKQVADGLISSKQKIAKGAIDIIDNSIKELEKRKICHFKEEEKSKLVSNMLVVLNMDKGGKTLINIK